MPMPPRPADSLRQAAAEALKAGDMKRLAQLADLMAATRGETESTHGETAEAVEVSAVQPGSARLWSSDTLTRARYSD
jgi:hypothetical protein